MQHRELSYNTVWVIAVVVYLVEGGGPPVLLSLLADAQVQRLVLDIQHPGPQHLRVIKPAPPIVR